MGKIFFTVVLLFFCTIKSYAQKKVEAEQRVSLKGTLKFERFYGAPGFGESPGTDAKEDTYILHLANPILFRDTSLSGVEFTKVNAIHVRFLPGDNIVGVNLRKFKNQKIEINCTLYGSHTGHHHAPAVTEQVYSIKKM